VQRIVVRWTPGLTNLLHFYTTDRPIPKVSITPPPKNDRGLVHSLKPLQSLMAWISQAHDVSKCLVQDARSPLLS
jgi:hypothetical protein